MSEWISVKDRLPEDDERIRFFDNGISRFAKVLGYDGTQMFVATRELVHRTPAYDGEDTETYKWLRFWQPTHWMPLPEPPKDETQKVCLLFTSEEKLLGVFSSEGNAVNWLHSNRGSLTAGEVMFSRAEWWDIDGA